MRERQPADAADADRGHAKELEMLYGALDLLQSGIVLLDRSLNAQFINRAVRKLWKVPDEQANRKPTYAELVSDTRTTGTYGVLPDQLETYIATRIATVRAGDPTPIDIPHSNGHMIRSQCAVLPNGGRMVIYTDVTDLVNRANQFEQLATIDGMTGLCNRRHFDQVAAAEWQRYQRYQRPLSLMLMDIDCFKQINDRFGHETGDRAIKQVAAVCAAEKRASDTAARIGGDEFAILLPETDLHQARIAAERLRQSIVRKSMRPEDDGGSNVAITVSVGIATASVSMSGFDALMRATDKGLYVAKADGRNCTRCAEPPAPDELRAAAE